MMVLKCSFDEMTLKIVFSSNGLRKCVFHIHQNYMFFGPIYGKIILVLLVL